MRITFTLLLVFSGVWMFAQNPALEYSRARVSLEGKSPESFLPLLDITHGYYEPNKSYTNDFSKAELDRLTQKGFTFEILIEDVQAYYEAQNKDILLGEDEGECGGSPYNYDVPVNFSLGNMAGFFTYQEMLDHLDAMHTLYPNLISQRAPIGTQLTHQGNPIYWLRISNNPNVDEDKPEVFYNSLHHAREPNSMSQLIYYMWYLLERYETDDEIKYLVDNLEMYFVPCVNPDGYIFNETNFPDGGGLWRKNLRDNDGDGSITEFDGVDLNRNYGLEWGLDDSGSSPDPWSNVYRGEEPFSEPETQIIREFCNDHQFKIALNYHSFGNLLIYPWAYSDSPATDDFVEMGEALVRENNYLAGTTTETVGYQVNGSSDDWMYGETDSKPSIYAFTPEVGDGGLGFWPPITKIIENCQSALLQNLTAGHLLLKFGLVTGVPISLGALETTIPFNFKRYGIQDGPLTLSITAGSDNIASIDFDPVAYDLAAFENVDNSLTLNLDPLIGGGEEVVLLFNVDNGIYQRVDTFRLNYSITESIFTESGENLDNWFSFNEGSPEAEWGIATNDFYSAPSSITDSPNSGYEANTLNSLLLTQTISLIDAVDAKLRFWTRWWIENGFDYTQVSVSVDNGNNFIPLCGKYTKEGNSTHADAEGEPLYDGYRQNWVEEEMDLSDYVGNDVLIRFDFWADGGYEADGFYFDDFEVVKTTGAATSTQKFEADDFVQFKTRPNPVDDYMLVDYNSTEQATTRLFVENLLGQTVYTATLNGPNGIHRVDTQNWSEGVYSYRIVLGDKMTSAKKVVVAH